MTPEQNIEQIINFPKIETDEDYQALGDLAEDESED